MGESELPTASDALHSVPVVDIGALMDASWADDSGPSEALTSVVHQIAAAAEEWGFFYIANHGVTEDDLTRFQQNMRAFFRLPKELKKTISRHATNSRGYFDHELTKNKVDWKEGLDFGGRQEDGPAQSSGIRRMGDDENQWLGENELPGFRAAMRDYFDRMEHISQRLIMAFSLALGKPPTYLDKYFTTTDSTGTSLRANSSFLRLNYYPVSPEPEKSMGVHHHTDAGAVTVLLQDDDVASLQVLHRATQEWHLIPPRPGTFVINIGDMLQVWSNDRFIAPLHRVLANGRSERFSAPFFYNPSYDAVIEPVPTVAADGDPTRAKYEPFGWFDFRLKRFQGDYADHGEEV
ncbi:hypothetical protein PINS_up011370 [Pythium insidiosum]|nr:hypothetical protein PINS_up011370 [Pythium insidiosum]